MSSPITVSVAAGLLLAMAGLVVGDYLSSRALVCFGLVCMACSLLGANRALGRAREGAIRKSDGMGDSKPAHR